jgi:hypothetical protein
LSLIKRYGGSSSEQESRLTLSESERSYLRRYTADNGLPISQYLTATTAQQLLAEGRLIAARTRQAQATQPLPPGQSSPYIVDGLALGSKVRFESEAYSQYDCKPSEKFPGFTWCHKEQTKREGRNEITSSNSILHAQDGTANYINLDEPSNSLQAATSAYEGGSLVSPSSIVRLNVIDRSS